MRRNIFDYTKLNLTFTLVLAGCVAPAGNGIEYASASFSDKNTVYVVNARADNYIGCEIGFGWSDVNYSSRDSRLVKITVLDHSGNTIDEVIGVLPSIARDKSGLSSATAVSIPCSSIGGFRLAS